MRSIWPLLQQLPTSFEHEGAKAQCLKDARQGLKLSDTHPGPHFMQPNCKIQQFLTPLSPSVYGRPLWIVPKHTIIIIIPDPTVLAQHFLVVVVLDDRQTQGARDHDTLAHSLVSKSGHGRKNVAVRASTSPEHQIWVLCSVLVVESRENLTKFSWNHVNN